MGMGNVIVKKASHFISISVNCYRRGIWSVWGQRQRKRKNKKFNIIKNLKTPAYIGEEWKAPEGLDKKRQSFNT